METQTQTRNRLISELIRTPHGQLEEYIPSVQEGLRVEPDFLAHLIAWNLPNGKIRDSKVALPVLHWAELKTGLYRENAQAAIASLDPRNFLRAMRFGRGRVPVRQLKNLVKGYLGYREQVPGRWDRAALQHRRSMKELYALFHIEPSLRADLVLFKRHYPKGSVFEAVANLSTLKPQAAAGVILKHKIPFLVARSIVGNNTDVTLALLEQMSPLEVVTNARSLERLGVRREPALRAAFEQALERASQEKTLKTGKAIQAVQDKSLRRKLKATQEKQMGSVKGNWLVLADRSGSMRQAIESARQVSAVLARVAEKVHLVFFNYAPTYYDVTGLTLEKIQELTDGVTASGGTSVGCGLDYILSRGWEVDGIAIVSDGCENRSPSFKDTYQRAIAVWGKEVPVYLYLLRGDINRMQGLETFDLRSGVDYHSLPNLVQTMRTNRYALADEIMETPLLTLGRVFRKEKVYA